MSAGLKHTKAQQPLTSWRAKNRHCQQDWNTPRHSSHSHPGEPRTGIVSRIKTHQGTAATHFLESQGQALSARLETHQGTAATHKLESQGQALSADLKHIRHSSHSQAEELRTGIVSRLDTQQPMTATHCLESQQWASLVSFKHSEAWQSLTY